jgi:diaminopimelate decarboxylase
VKNLPIGTPNLGDMIIFYNTGAYSVTEGIYLFLSRKCPLITAVSYDEPADGKNMENIKVEVYRDVFASDVINSRKNVL